MQISSGQCPDRSRGTDTDLKALLRELYPVLVMNIATNNVMGGKIDVSQALQELLDGNPRIPKSRTPRWRASTENQQAAFAAPFFMGNCLLARRLLPCLHTPGQLCEVTKAQCIDVCRGF